MRSHSLIEVRAALALVPSLVRASQKRLEILPSYGLPQAIRVGPAAAPALHGAAKTARVAASVLNAFVDLPRRSPQALPAHATLLCGAPIAVKANICVGGELVAGAASRMLAGYVPVHTATVVERLQSAGGVVVGATNMDEFGMGSSTNASVHGPSYNPASPPAAFLRANAGADPAAIERALARPEWVSAWLSPGGSSGGAAVAVATGGAVAGVGSDTGGSVRLPAALCGLVGFKPTYGAIPRWGLIAYASSLDTIGLITRTVADAAVLFDVVRSPDDRDETAALAETAAREMQLAAANAFASHLAASTGSAHPHPHDAARDHLSEDQDARAAPAPTDPRSTDHMTLPSHERPTVGDRHRTYRPDRADLLQCGHDYPHRRWRRALEGREMGAYPPSRSDLIGRPSQRKPLAGLRIGIPADYFIAELHPAIAAAWDTGAAKLADAGATIVPVRLLLTKAALAAYYVIAPAEASSNLARYDGVRYGYRAGASASGGRRGGGSVTSAGLSTSPEASHVTATTAGTFRNSMEASSAAPKYASSAGARAVHDLFTATRTSGFGPEVVRRILTGTFVLSTGGRGEFYDAASIVRRMVVDEFDGVFRDASAMARSVATARDHFSADGRGHRRHPDRIIGAAATAAARFGKLSSPLDDAIASGSASPDAGVDLLLCPTTATLPWPSVGAGGESSATAAYALDVMTVPASLARLPAISVPVGHADPEAATLEACAAAAAACGLSSDIDVASCRLPIGLQLIGRFADDYTVLAVGAVLEA